MMLPKTDDEGPFIGWTRRYMLRPVAHCRSGCSI